MNRKNNQDSQENIKETKVLIIYDDLQISYLQTKKRFDFLFNSIQLKNDKKEKTQLFHKSEQTKIILDNKYYRVELNYYVFPISKIEEIVFEDYEGIILYLDEMSVKNNIFCELAKTLRNYEFSSSIILFDASRDDISSLPEYTKLISDSIDKNFEIICNCANSEYNVDDGLGALNSSLHSTMWKNSKKVQKKEKINSDWPINLDKERKEINEKKEKLNSEKINQDFDKLIVVEEQTEKLLQKIKEIKTLNLDPNISDEDRRKNAEEVVIMMINIFGLDDEDELPENNDDNK